MAVVLTDLLYFCIVMEIDAKHKLFIKEHLQDDVNKLLLSSKRFSDINMELVVDQIISRRQIREKLPSWYGNYDLYFPAKITVEQCSSEQTARYKQRLFSAGSTVCDLTGGLGIDAFFISQVVGQIFYVERYKTYCDVARHNFDVLRAWNISVKNGDSSKLLDTLPKIDAFYIDPARRGCGNKRVYALEDCEPNLPELLPELFRKADIVVAKLSPMADLQATLRLLLSTKEIHVLSVRNECKELLFVLDRTHPNGLDPLVKCVNYTSEGKEESFEFLLSEETGLLGVETTNVLSAYLYEPNVSILKAGAFKMVSVRFGMKKLHVNSHLYTSDDFVDDFPGKRFKVETVYPFSNRLCRSLSSSLPKVNITVRNFPLSVKELRDKMKISEGGDLYLFATTLADGAKVLVLCSRT